MADFTEAYPLYWPEGRSRTSPWNRNASKFRTAFTKARDEVVRQVELLVGRWGFNQCGFVLSTNISLRRDGLPLAGQRQPDDPGAAVYFMRNKRRICFACDKWNKVEDNIYAIAKTIEALRGIDRWGTGDMVDAAFNGFEALPAPKPWWTVLRVERNASAETINYVFRELAKSAHPDKGGSTAVMAELVRAREDGLRACGVAA